MRKKSKVDSGAGITKPELSKAISMAKSSQSSQEDTSEIPSWVKLDKRHPQQLKHDMKVLKYLIRGHDGLYNICKCHLQMLYSPS